MTAITAVATRQRWGRHIALVPVLAGTVMLAGCVKSVGRTNDEDRSRAAVAQRDSWLSPTTLQTPQPAYGSDGQVLRRVGERRSTVSPAPAAAAGAQVARAIADGWALTYVSCATTSSSASAVATVSMRLRKVATGLAAQVGAEVSVAALSATDGGGTGVEVTGLVPHHLDRSWPAFTIIDPTSTCLRTGRSGTSGSTDSVPPEASAPLK